MNRYKVSYYERSTSTWIEVTGLVFPLGLANLLDERLDEFNITFYNSYQKTFAPTTLFRIILSEDGVDVKTVFAVVASDNAQETPVGTGKYKHSLYLIEPTKLMEGVQCQTLTFTNDLGAVFTDNGVYALPDVKIALGGGDVSEDSSYYLNADAKEIYKTPMPRGDSIIIKSPKWISEQIEVSKIIGSYPTSQADISSKVVIGDYTYSGDEDFKFDVTSEAITISYEIVRDWKYVNYEGVPTSRTVYITITYNAIAVENKYPLLPYTITDAVTRCLELADPLWLGDIPRITFDGVSYASGVGSAVSYAAGSQAEKYSSVFAPELTVTQANLREQLCRIGDHIHGEPRLDVQLDAYGTPKYILRYDLYGEVSEADLSRGTQVYAAASQSINEYCTDIRANAANLVNSLEYAKGVVIEPCKDGYKSLRATENTRIDESNGTCEMSSPIYELIKVECGLFDRTDKKFAFGPVDITAYAVEKSAYALLSEYELDFPQARSLAFYYTQGQKDLGGFFFKSPSLSVFEPWQEYAIVRILARALQTSEDTVGNKFNALGGAPSLFLRVSYVPIYSGMISHSKQSYVKGQEPFSQIYNQSENLVEVQYFGENIKGVAARLGEVEEERTYIFKSIKDVPKAGQTVPIRDYNGRLTDYYSISAVSASFLPTYTKVTLGLTHKFNRISEHIGINSHKRVYEVSERETYERHILIKQNAVISSNLKTSYSRMITAPYYTVSALDNKSTRNRLTALIAQGYSKSGKPVGSRISLPVIASALGNAMTFTWAYKDNYSAGAGLNFFEWNNISGRWTKDVPYCDYYGRIYSYEFHIGEAFDALPDGDSLPASTAADDDVSGLSIATYNTRYLMRKDSREKISCTVEIEFQTTDSDLVIGSALASGNALIANEVTAPVLYTFDTPINNFQRCLTAADFGKDSPQSHQCGVVSVTNEGGYATISFPDIRDAQGAGKYWVLAYPIREVEGGKYEDEDGNVKTKTEQKGGEILLSCLSKTGRAGDAVHPPLYVTIQK